MKQPSHYPVRLASQGEMIETSANGQLSSCIGTNHSFVLTDIQDSTVDITVTVAV
jgi:hypothetical protein